MEKIVVKDNINEIGQWTKASLKQIINNANKGMDVTELMIPKHIALEVRDSIDKELIDSGTKFTWVAFRTGRNQFTGRTEYFTGETIGDYRKYMLRILK